MAVFTCFAARMRIVGPVTFDTSPLGYYIASDCGVVDADGNVIPTDGSGGDPNSGFVEGLYSLEPLEIGDDAVDFRRKAVANLRGLFTENIDVSDTINVVWIDAS